ncbi:TauD/TfdA dioxygenase family protein [Winogradskya humida]|uniref:TauD/TfdA-like domain-containing protein n=1 Tax=Winogradskya humida TaxID=113566 RepID=A0ABQ4A0A4_9ACTN|nr:TauD/TfdA family dioxygenase [Actinoplanes humidus]GIE24295.1 hypothetical protein Ahu01nite_073970 [Actinoplanes humidus]
MSYHPGAGGSSHRRQLSCCRTQEKKALPTLGLTPPESRQLLDLFFEQITRAEYTVRLRWRPGIIAFWDNRATAHLTALDNDHLRQPRVLHRVTIVGDAPVGADGFVSQPVQGESFDSPKS